MSTHILMKSIRLLFLRVPIIKLSLCFYSDILKSPIHHRSQQSI